MARLSDRQKAALDNSGALIPVGSIIAYAPGYFGAVANGGGWSVSGPSLNTVASVNSYLPSNWKVCDGTAPNDSASPIFNSGSRYLPDLTGSRFIKGNTTAGSVGGNASNQVTLTSANLPTHTHDAGTLATASSGNHNHITYARNHLHGGPVGLGNTWTGNIGVQYYFNDPTSTDGAHTHTISGSTGNGGFTNTAFSILPLYVDVFYIMRIK